MTHIGKSTETESAAAAQGPGGRMAGPRAWLRLAWNRSGTKVGGGAANVGGHSLTTGMHV